MEEAQLRRDDAEDIWLTAMMQAPPKIRHGLVREMHLSRRGRKVLDHMRGAMAAGYTRITPELLKMNRDDLGTIPVRWGHGPITEDASNRAESSIISHWQWVATALTYETCAKIAREKGPVAAEAERRRRIADINTYSQGVTLATPDEQVEAYLQDKRAYLDPTTGTRTDFPELDKLADGWKPGREAAIWTYTGGGKSTLATQLAMQKAMHGTPTGYINLEDDQDIMGARHVATFLEGTPESLAMLRRFNRNEHTEQDIMMMHDAMAQVPFDRFPMFTAYLPGAPLEKIQATIVEMARRGVKDVTVDYAQKLPTPGAKGKSDRESMQALQVDALHNVASEYGMHFTIVIQVARPSEKDPENMAAPGLHSARGSGEYENNASIILIPWRFKKGREGDNGLENASILVPKVKTGRPGEVNVFWDVDRHCFLLPQASQQQNF